MTISALVIGVLQNMQQENKTWWHEHTHTRMHARTHARTTHTQVRAQKNNGDVERCHHLVPQLKPQGVQLWLITARKFPSTAHSATKCSVPHSLLHKIYFLKKEGNQGEIIQ